MTVTLELKPETEARATAEAKSRGMSVEKFLSAFIEDNLNDEAGKHFSETATFEEWEREFRAWVESHTRFNHAPPLSDEAISRESIYREREDAQL